MRYLIVRIGAWGDCVVVSPLLRYLKEQGNEVYVLTSEQGLDIFRHNPHIDKLIYHKRDSVPLDKLFGYFKDLQKEHQCDKLVDLCESMEEKYIFHPTNPRYNYPKFEREKICDHNFYDAVFEIAGFPKVKGRLPEMYFSDEEEREFLNWRSELLGRFIIIWCLSGSGLHKSYPYTHLVMRTLLNKYPDIVFLTVGDDKCRILERALVDDRIIHLSGVWSIRETAIACKYAGLVISPETATIHLSGCFNTPKICFLTHTTKECLTKYFRNDYSLQADVDCSPCFRLIFEASHQCPIDWQSYAPWCAAFGFKPEKIVSLIEDIYLDNQYPKNCTEITV